MPYYMPRDQSWFEQKFNYRITITLPRSPLWVDRYGPIRAWLESDPDRWGVYREDWFGHVWTNATTEDYSFFFMCRDRAMLFRLSVDI